MQFLHGIVLMLGASICWGHSVSQTLALVNVISKAITLGQNFCVESAHIWELYLCFDMKTCLIPTFG